MRGVVFIAVVLVLAAFPGCARAADFGFNDGRVLDGVPDERETQLLADVGGQVHRFTLNWRGTERVRGRYDFARYDSIYAADLRRGVRPLIILAFAPDWTWDRGISCPPTELCPYPPSARHMRAWRKMVKQVVRRYPKMVALEVWNEPNLPAYWPPEPQPARYADLVRHADRAVRATGSDVPVLAGSLSDGPVKGGLSGMDPARFLSIMLRSGARGRYDGLSIHPYPQGLDLSPTFETLRSLGDVRARFGDSTPLWVTEVGASAPAEVTVRQQAALLVRLVEMLGARPDVRAVLVHTLLAPYAGVSTQNGFGIVSADGTARPAYCALARLRLRSPSNCRLGPFALPDEPRLEHHWDAQASVAAATEAASAHARANAGSLEGFAPGTLSPPPEQAAGPTADPEQVGVYRFGEGEDRATLLCAASRADNSYCAMSMAGTWTYGHAAGSIGSAANATIRGENRGW